jgi:hypothetical protein
VEEYEPGVWLVCTASIVPDNERWLHSAEATGGLREALAWSQAHPARDDDSDECLKRWRDESA